MDNWSQSQILSMLEGGNDQLNNFFHRYSHPRCNYDLKYSGNNNRMEIYERRYKSKSSQLYRNLLTKHVNKVISKGAYTGKGIEKLSRLNRKKNNQYEKKVSMVMN